MPSQRYATYYNSNRAVTLIPNKVTLSRFPEELNVDTSSGKPNKRADFDRVPGLTRYAPA